ncbi:hypothetical protein [Crenobacter cavernae]|uniref:ABC transporter substrate-binding protein n=1 Tax=Crenobacter cavernae TaxID=2290923 RepID=A0ABY0FEZ9_9NEIS|nr:hypothetical protein [Crenobacter cavernae]RXZ44880.1 hypothetical protein EBB06_03020 [Crenobacter cavernae]
MQVLIGIDDTDTLDSPGTGQRTRELAKRLALLKLAEPLDITRHQFLKSPHIAYTSHNSGACLMVSPRAALPELVDACRHFVAAAAAPGSDPGLCVAMREQVGRAIERFGARARYQIVTQAEAHALAHEAGIYLEGLGGDLSGAIGALASVGQRVAGGPGLLIWLPLLHTLAGRTLCATELTGLVGIDRLLTADGRTVGRAGETVWLGDWPRPVLMAGQRVLLVEEGENDVNDADWWVLPKDRVKQYWG